MLFSQVCGHSELKNKLRQSVLQGRVSHAQLFLGPEGSGNLPMALAYAQFLNCEQRTESDACGSCPSCIKAEKYVHPDIHFTFPFIASDKEKKEKCADWLPEWRAFLDENAYGNYNHWIRFIQRENKQGNINARECSDIIHRLSFKTFESSWKVLVLWLPEFLEKEGNRLLKLIEEPPEQTVFLFVAHNPDRIINTILSRLQIVPFSRYSDEEIARTLAEKEELELDSARKIAVLSNGSLSRALELINVNQESYTATLREWMLACFKGEIGHMFQWNDNYVKWGKEQQKHFFFYCIHFFREVFLYQQGVDVLNRMTEEEKKFAEGLGQKLHPESLEKILTLFDKYIYFIERNVSSKIMITQMSISFKHLFHNQPADIRNPFFTGWDA